MEIHSIAAHGDDLLYPPIRTHQHILPFDRFRLVIQRGICVVTIPSLVLLLYSAYSTPSL